MISGVETIVTPIWNKEISQTESEYWKAKYLELKSQLENNIITNPNAAIFLKEKGLSNYILLSKIVMLQAESNYTTFHLSNGQSILTSKTLKYWIIRLGALDPVFERIHRSFLINRNHILSYNSIEKCLLMTGNRTVKVARRQKIQL